MVDRYAHRGTPNDPPSCTRGADAGLSTC